MAWLSGLAGKAENLLNKIDKNTAAALSKEKNEYEQISQGIANRSPQHVSMDPDTVPNVVTESPMHAFLSARSNPAPITASSIPTTIVRKEDELMTYLNTPTKTLNEVATGPPTPSSLRVEHSAENSDSISDLIIHSGRTSPEPLQIVLDLSDNDSLNGDSELDVNKENAMLRNEIEKLRNELLVTTHVERSIESEHSNFQHKLNTLRQEYEYRLTQQRLEMENLIKRSRDGDAKKSLKAARKNLDEKTELLSKQQTDHQKEINVLREKLRALEIEGSENLKKLGELQSALDRSRSDLNTTRIELEQHRARAMKTLQEKEKLIAELRNDSNAGSENDTMIMELNQLRQECEALRDENQQVREQLRLAREELTNADTKLEEMSRKSIDATREAHDVISAERRKRIEAEEDAQVHLEEVRSLREELASQVNSATVKFRKQETEITRLRSQLSAASTPSSAVESRLASLTQTLVSKQQALESLTTEKNALRLQLEKMEQEYRKIVASSRRNGSYNSVNDTDDAKAQVPTFFMESPFDTSVTRRVKRAYSTLDAISVRTGIFLRRYPFARIFVIIYMALLQFWVLVVLLSQSPDPHCVSLCERP